MSNILLPKPALGTPIAKGQLLSKGLVGNYSFSDGRGDILSDFSLEKNHGTIIGPTWVGDGLDFDVANDIVTKSQSLDTSISAFTYIFDVTFGTVGEDEIFLAGHISNNTAVAGQVIGIDGLKKFNIEIYRTLMPARITMNPPLSDNVRVTLAVTRPNNDAIASVLFYKNGLPAEIGNIYEGMGTRQTAPGSESLGGRIYDNLRQLDATIHDIKIYNRVLSTSEIAQLYIKPDLSMQQPPIWLFTPPVVSAGMAGIYYRTLMQGVA